MKTSISTHTPLAGRDLPVHENPGRVQFLLTRPLRGATRMSVFAVETASLISTHTPLAGRDISFEIAFANS